MKNKFYSFFKFNSVLKDRFKKKPINNKFWVPLVFTPLIFAKNVLFLKEEKESDELGLKDIIRGEYENRIRVFSTIEKKFLIFSRVKSTDELKMSYFQFLESVVPFQYMKELNEDQLKEVLMNNALFQSLLKKIDLNNDGFINFEEYVIWSLIISVSINHLKSLFPKGTLTREQFSDYLMESLNSSNVFKVTDKAVMDARIIKSDKDTIFKTLVDFTSKCFNDNVLSIDNDIEKLIVDLSLSMLIYEFYRIPSKVKDAISGEAFAKVILSYINIYKTKKFKKKIDEHKIPLEFQVHINEFIYFFLFLRYLTNSRFMIFNEKTTLSFDDLKKLSQTYLKNSMKIPGMTREISDEQLKTLVTLLDDNGDGFLQFDEINGILKRRSMLCKGKQDFIDETSSIKQFFLKGFQFIKDNLWFIK